MVSFHSWEDGRTKQQLTQITNWARPTMGYCRRCVSTARTLLGNPAPEEEASGASEPGPMQHGPLIRHDPPHEAAPVEHVDIPVHGWSSMKPP